MAAMGGRIPPEQLQAMEIVSKLQTGLKLYNAGRFAYLICTDPATLAASLIIGEIVSLGQDWAEMSDCEDKFNEYGKEVYLPLLASVVEGALGYPLSTPEGQKTYARLCEIIAQRSRRYKAKKWQYAGWHNADTNLPQYGGNFRLATGDRNGVGIRNHLPAGWYEKGRQCTKLGMLIELISTTIDFMKDNFAWNFANLEADEAIRRNRVAFLLRCRYHLSSSRVKGSLILSDGTDLHAQMASPPMAYLPLFNAALASMQDAQGNALRVTATLSAAEAAALGVPIGTPKTCVIDCEKLAAKLTAKVAEAKANHPKTTVFVKKDANMPRSAELYVSDPRAPEGSARDFKRIAAAGSIGYTPVGVTLLAPKEYILRLRDTNGTYSRPFTLTTEVGRSPTITFMGWEGTPVITAMAGMGFGESHADRQARQAQETRDSFRLAIVANGVAEITGSSTKATHVVRGLPTNAQLRTTPQTEMFPCNTPATLSPASLQKFKDAYAVMVAENKAWPNPFGFPPREGAPKVAPIRFSGIREATGWAKGLDFLVRDALTPTATSPTTAPPKPPTPPKPQGPTIKRPAPQGLVYTQRTAPLPQKKGKGGLIALAALSAVGAYFVIKS
jgi:hypothetical protein